MLPLSAVGLFGFFLQAFLAFTFWSWLGVASSNKPGRVSLDDILKEILNDPDLSPETKEDMRHWLRKAKKEFTKGKKWKKAAR